MNTIDLIEPFQLRQLFESSADKYPKNTALICDDVSLSYQELEWRANQLANYLIGKGLRAKQSVAILLERSPMSYISILAVLKIGATYVPIEIEYPDERINYILKDMSFHTIITSSTQAARSGLIQLPNPIALDELETALSAQSNHRPELGEADADQICYVIYTSGSTGKPKGVEIAHSSICHYVTTASKLYQMAPKDRIYQGFSLAFDASLEELWMAFANGASLIACTSKDIRSGVGLIEFLTAHEVTVFSTVPTLLATLEANLPALRLLILGGEACTAQLIKPWGRDSLRIINTYGPTEATVIATSAECFSDKPVTIGKPLPGYDIFILDETLRPVADGQQGQLCIAGLGLARGYVNQPENTEKKFITNPTNKNQRLYLTGDLAVKNLNGDIEFLGRIDDQVKLRGFRIELNEIETIIMEYEGISQAIVSLQTSNKPTLIAYLLLQEQTPFDMQHFKHFLQQRLPNYMIPSLIEPVSSFPLLSSGKVNRKALPIPTNSAPQTAYAPPTTELEMVITKIWEESLQQNRISIDDDFFYDLGGHSLSAASIVSSLRKIAKIKNISILDLYQNPTIRQLSEKFTRIQHHEKNEERKPKKHRASQATYALCGVGQFFGCLLQYAIRSWQLLAVVCCYSWFTMNSGLFSMDTLATFLLLFVCIPISSLAITICAKWLLLGRVKPGIHKVWGWFYFRWWLVERLQKNVFSPHHLIGSPILILYYRLLGAKIGKNCYIGTSSVAAHDMLTIGDNCSIGFDARLLGYIIEDGWLKIGTITIGDHCFVGARSVISIDTVLNENACLDDMSMLPTHRFIPAGQFYSGSPARQSLAPQEHVINQRLPIDKTSPLKNFYFGVLHYICLEFGMGLYYICFLPALLLITYFHEQTHFLLTIFVAAPLGAIIFLALYYLGVCVCKKILMDKIKPGIYSLKSIYYLRQWTIVRMLDVPEISIMADSLYFPSILRFLGANLGKRVEMGETPHIIPDLVTIQDEGFTASSVALAWPSVYQGAIRFAPVTIGKRGFVGNLSMLPLGGNIGDEGLLGCMTITPPNDQAGRKQTAWLGSPAVFLPNRELYSGFSEADKFTPPKRLFRLRLAIEFARIIMPTTLNLVGVFSLLYLLDVLLSNFSLASTAFMFPIAEAGISIGLIAIIVLLKWVLLGKLKPGTKPIWNVFIWKLDVCEYLYTYFVHYHFINIVLGTPFAAILFRSYGAKIGKRVVVNTPDFAEFDLISIGNEVCLNADVLVQTHLYEDRIFKVSTIDIHDGCNVGVGSIVLYNTTMEKNSTLGNFSLLMKGETLPENTNWQGIPAQPMSAHDDGLREDVPVTIGNPSADTLILETE
jgi:non-ribosomal peptide synthetase-like protein